MDFSLSDQEEQIQRAARAFARQEILPRAGECDREKRFPEEVARQARELGFLELTVPEEHGGPGLSGLEAVLVQEELGWACTGIASALGINNLLCDALLLAGTADQREWGLARLRSGYGAYALTEPEAGSDAAALRTRAHRSGTGYVLDGRKTWITMAPLASLFLVFAKTDPEAGHRGISAFLVERDRPGVQVSNPLPKMGQRAAPAAEVAFEAVQVPEEARLGPEGSGFRLAMQVFDRSRPTVAALAVGLAQRCLDEAVRYAAGRRAFGRPIAEFQGVGFKLADMEMRVRASRWLTRHAAWLVSRGQPSTSAAACAKAFAADSAMAAAVETVQVFGGYGYSEEYPAEKLMRDAKVLQIYEGTSEIQRAVVARELVRSLG